MKSKGGFFSGLLTFFLIAIIIGGVGFLGYNILKNANTGMNMSMNMPSNSTQDKQSDKDNSSSQNQMNMDKDKKNDNSSNNDTDAAKQVNLLLQNKQNLDKAITSLNESLSLMTLDPYGVDNKNQSGETSQQTTKENGQAANPASGTTTQGNTTVNVYTSGNGASNGNMMQNMGVTYDQNKMEQFHSGLYKISIGVQLLGQLKDNLSTQIEQTQVDVKDPSKYYINQYNLIMQNKNKLNEALAYVNEAVNVLNVNPYTASNGMSYDKDRMQKVHESITKFAETVVTLNKLSDDFTKHAVYVGNLAQNYSNMNQMNSNSMNMPGMSGGLFTNFSFSSVMNIAFILFISLFIIGMAGLIFSLLKPSKTQ